MKVRAWRIWTAADDGEAWFQHCDETVLHELTSAAGNRGVFVLWRTEADETEFVVLSLWDDEESAAAESALAYALAHLEQDGYTVRRDFDAEYACVSRGAIALTAALSFDP